ncbi:MAG TPA: pantetheine-phosphate adenylyltransferase [Polyangia bacterium]|jgi:pantetheine-phosphate adenylyltransferase
MRVALYAGTFDPITRGHLSVIERAADLFDRLVVVVAVNPSKQPLFSPDERVAMIREVVAPRRNVECTSTAGYVVDLARERAARYLVRGVRSCTDVDGEIALADMNRALAPEIETVFIPAHPSLSEVSSSRLKELASRGEDVSLYCPPEIAARLQQRVAAATLAREEGAHA